MALLTRKIDYALLVLSHLRHHEGGDSAREIAGRYGLSRSFVANILKELCHKGYVVSHRGVHGGYDLARELDDLSLAEFIESLGESFQLTECTDHAPGAGCDHAAGCPLRGPIERVHRRIRSVLAEINLGELFRPCGNGSPPELLSLSVP